jgi:MinD superfamily P-loop ATPase
MPGSTTEGIDLKVAVLSGKGGTGKTLVAVSLAAAAKHSTYVDCDVEEPNGHLFFRPEQVEEESVTVAIPAVDHALCTGCRSCVQFCQFNALAYTGQRLIIFDDVCHSCGGCVLVCPQKALTERDKSIGKVQKGVSEGVDCLTGVLNIGEASGVPIIQELLSGLEEASSPVFIDCPPGSACTVMESIKEADYCILVVEPTLFGVHNLQMVLELVQLFQKPFGVVINKCLPGENPAEAFCLERGLGILAQIPFSKDLGWINSQGRIAVREEPVYRALFQDLWAAVCREVRRESKTVAHSKR